MYWRQSYRFLSRTPLKTRVKPKKQPLQLFHKKRCSQKFYKFHKKTSVLKINSIDTAIIRSRRLEVFCKKGVLTNFAKFTRKNLRQSLVLRSYRSTELNFIEKRDSGTCLLVNSTKFLVRPFLKNLLDGCFCINIFRLFKNDVTHIFRLSILSA